MSGTVAKALELWGHANAPFRLIAARENAVYRVDTSTGPFALRLHRQGYRTDAQLRSELDWMAALSIGGLSVPAPIPSQTGALLHVIDDTQVDALTWVQGQTMDDALNQTNRAATFRNLGAAMARLHTISDAWSPPQSFDRALWDRYGLLGEAPLWDRFWDNPALDRADEELFQQFRNHATEHLHTLEDSLDYGLIHADLVAGNVIIDGTQIHMIDFDDSGYGFRLFDVATALLKHHAAADFVDLQSALLDGYRAHRPLDTTHLALFTALRATTYVGWNITRAQEDATGTRNARFIDTARRMVTAYLQTK